jgi:hypothetical protein
MVLEALRQQLRVEILSQELSVVEVQEEPAVEQDSSISVELAVIIAERAQVPEVLEARSTSEHDRDKATQGRV